MISLPWIHLFLLLLGEAAIRILPGAVSPLPTPTQCEAQWRIYPTQTLHCTLPGSHSRTVSPPKVSGQECGLCRTGEKRARARFTLIKLRPVCELRPTSLFSFAAQIRPGVCQVSRLHSPTLSQPLSSSSVHRRRGMIGEAGRSALGSRGQRDGWAHRWVAGRH